MRDSHKKAFSKQYRAWVVALTIIVLSVGFALLMMKGESQKTAAKESEILEAVLAASQPGMGEDRGDFDLSDIPRYMPSQRLASTKESANGISSFWVLYRCQGELDKVSAFYEQAMLLQGWTLASKEVAILQMYFVKRNPDSQPIMAQLDFRPVSPQETIVGITITEITP